MKGNLYMIELCKSGTALEIKDTFGTIGDVYLLSKVRVSTMADLFCPTCCTEVKLFCLKYSLYPCNVTRVTLVIQ